MVLMTTSVTIARTPPEVFSYISNFENMPEWADDVAYCRKTTEGPAGAGTTYELAQVRMGGKTYASTVRLLDIDPDHRISAETEIGPLALKLDFVVEPVADGTEVTVNGNGELRGFLRFLAPIGARQGRRIWDRRLASLKETLES